MAIYELKGDQAPEELASVPFRRTTGAGFVETHGTPIAVNGRLYFLTQDALYCVGDPKAQPKTGPYKPLPAEAEYKKDAAPVSIRIFPADVLTKPGETIKFEKKYLDANGRAVAVPNVGGGWELALPPVPKGATKGPPRLEAHIEDRPPVGPGAQEDSVKITVDKALPAQQGYVQAEADKMPAARSRVRVAAQLPYTQTFDKTPTGVAPAGWVNVQSKYVIVEKDGNKVLSKVNTDSRPPFARANGYMTGPTASNYTVEVDVLGTEVRGRLPDMGLVNSRYTLILDGKSDSPNGKRQVRIVSWEARMRVNQEVEFDWQPGVWYRVKFSVVPNGKTASLLGKVWKKGEAEPADWTVKYEDPNPNREGAAALYAYISDPSINAKEPGSDVFFDNVAVSPNAKK
jgi:hypothetical protein